MIAHEESQTYAAIGCSYQSATVNTRGHTALIARPEIIALAFALRCECTFRIVSSKTYAHTNCAVSIAHRLHFRIATVRNAGRLLVEDAKEGRILYGNVIACAKLTKVSAMRHTRREQIAPRRSTVDSRSHN